MIKCAIDIGTNSVRILIAEVDAATGTITPLYRDGTVTRLGQGVTFLGTIRRDAAERTISAVKNYIIKARQFNVESCTIIATSAARDAVNGKFVLQDITESMGEKVRILTGQEEAAFIYKGVSASLGMNGADSIIIDIGGGSTEFIITGHKGGTVLKSINAGAVRMTEGLIKNDVPAPEDIDRACASCYEAYYEGEIPEGLTAQQLIGVGGTITTLAAIKYSLQTYDRAVVHDSILTLEEVQEILLQLSAVPLAQRKEINGLAPDRADIIIAGTLVLIFIMEKLNAQTIRVCDDGILTGLLI